MAEIIRHMKKGKVNVQTGGTIVNALKSLAWVIQQAQANDIEDWRREIEAELVRINAERSKEKAKQEARARGRTE
jgi:hypothetical protein